MARPKVVSVTGVADSAAIPINWRAKNFGVSLGVSNPSGNTFTVQHTFDDIYNIAAGSLVWHDHDSAALAAATTTTADGNYAFPIRALRLRSTVGAGTVTLTIIQND